MIHILVALVLVGVLLYIVEMIPMDAVITKLIRIVVILGAFLYVLQALGLWRGAW